MSFHSQKIYTWIKKYPLLTFFFLTYGIAWGLWIPALISDYGTGIVHIPPVVTIPLLAVGTLGPGFAGWFISGVIDPVAGRRYWWSRLIKWHFHPIWYLYAVYLPFGVNFIANLFCIIFEMPSVLGNLFSSLSLNFHLILSYILLIPLQMQQKVEIKNYCAIIEKI